MIDFGVAYDKLAQFETADDIAEYFRSEGVTGRVAMHDSCPIASWMSQTTGSRVSAAGFIVNLDNTEGEYDTTLAMTDFMVAFDNLKYPDLIAKNDESR